MLRATLAVIGMALMLSVAVPASNALFYGPSILKPTSISVGSDITLTLTTVAASWFTAPPAGGKPVCTGAVCSYPLQSCTNPAYFYIAIHEIVVIDPNGNHFMLGSAKGSGLYWPSNQGGYYGNGGLPKFPPLANELNITVGQSDILSFGTGQTGASGASFASEDYHTGAPFKATPDTAGPYYWWTVAGSSYGSNLRLDQHPSIKPTTIPGIYTIDIEGVALCGTSATTIKAVLFFDAGVVVVTPEFGSSMLAVASVAFLLMMLVRRGPFGRRIGAPRTST